MSNQNKNEMTYVPESDVTAVRAELGAEKKDRKSFVKRAMAVGALAGTLIGIGGTKAVEALGQPEEHVRTTVDVTNEQSFEHVTVEKGDTMWNIAERVNAERDPRNTIAYLEEANPGVTPSSIQPGEVLQIPVDISDHDLSK